MNKENLKKDDAKEKQNSQLRNAVSAYEAALKELATNKSGNYPTRVLEVFLARDRVDQEFVNEKQIDPKTLIFIAGQDLLFKAGARTIISKIDAQTLANWRETARPAPEHWWWYIDQHQATEPKFNRLWIMLTWTIIAVSLSIIIEIVRRFLMVGVDVASTVLQGLVALFIGGTLVQFSGMLAQGKLFSSEKTFQRKRKVPIVLAISLVVFASLLIILLPSIAGYYSNKGVVDNYSGGLSSAIYSYQRAISLEPDDAIAHYNLASAYESIMDYDKAEVEYQNTIRWDAQLPMAYNNLARLFILRHKDYESALRLLKEGIKRFDQMEKQNMFNERDRKRIKYSLLKNRAWAHFAMGYFEQAADDLKEAIKERQEGGAAYCLLAQVLEGQRNRAKDDKLAKDDWDKQIVGAWDKCIAYSNDSEVPIEASWLSLSQERGFQEDAKRENEKGSK